MPSAPSHPRFHRAIYFAVPDEARPFLGRLRRLGSAPRRIPAPNDGPGVRTWAWHDLLVQVHGMGAQHARHAWIPEGLDWVITAGFAGGLDPSLLTGTVVLDASPGFPRFAALEAAGVRAGRFYCARRIAITAAEKQALRSRTSADAVEMESEFIRQRCDERNLPVATVRVISDPAHEDLPLDFNALLTPANQLSPRRLVGRVLRSPHRIPALIRFGGRTAGAANHLAEVLIHALNG